MQKMFVANKALIFNKEGKVLLVRDAGSSQDHKIGQGKWDIPGGRMDKEDRSLQEALLRELKEELGIEVDVSDADILMASLWSINGDDERRVTAIVYILHIKEAITVTLSQEHDDYRWFDPFEEIAEPMSPCLIQAMNIYRNKYA